MNHSVSALPAWRRNQVCQTLSDGGVIAYPTEAVWGLGCDPWNPDAVERVLALKQRPMRKGLILVAASVDQVRFLLDRLSPELQQRALQHWPGPVTCLLPDPDHQVPVSVKGEHSSIAVRVSAHPLVRALCEAAGQPLVSTSCNPMGRPPARYSWQVRRYFGEDRVHLVPGSLGSGRKPSRILDIVNERWLR